MVHTWPTQQNKYCESTIELGHAVKDVFIIGVQEDVES